VIFFFSFGLPGFRIRMLMIGYLIGVCCGELAAAFDVD